MYIPSSRCLGDTELWALIHQQGSSALWSFESTSRQVGWFPWSLSVLPKWVSKSLLSVCPHWLHIAPRLTTNRDAFIDLLVPKLLHASESQSHRIADLEAALSWGSPWSWHPVKDSALAKDKQPSETSCSMHSFAKHQIIIFWMSLNLEIIVFRRHDKNCQGISSAIFIMWLKR